MAEHCIPELGLEPGAFGRHNAAGIRNSHKVLDAGREHGKCAGVIAAVDKFFQLGGAANAANEIDALAGPWIVNAKDRLKHIFLKEGYVQFFDGISRSGESRAEMQA